ncbi:MAG: response regulator transcription factor [Opitutales bacterium]
MSSKPLILVVEDEKDLADLVGQQIEMAGMSSQVFYKPSHALRFLEHDFANLLLLDVNLPEMSGFELLSELRRKGIESPVIFLTGNASETFKVKGLEMGGDDYVTKPFSQAELVARIRAVLRRAETSGDKQVTKNVSLALAQFAFAGATINPERMEIVFPDGRGESIGRKELGIICAMNDNVGVVLSRRTLIHMVWGIHADVRSRSLDQYIVRIRNLLSKNACDHSSFRTVHGVGYIYDPEHKSSEGVETEA